MCAGCDRGDVIIECECLWIGPCWPPTTTGEEGRVDIRVDGSYNYWRSIWPSSEGSSWFPWCSQSPSKCLVSVIQVAHDGNITRHHQTDKYRRVVIVVILHNITITVNAFYPQLAWCSASAYYILQSTQVTNSLWHPVCRNGRDTEMFLRGQGKPEQLTLPLPPWSTQSLWSIFNYAHYFILVVFQIDDSSGWIGYSFPQGWCHRGIGCTCFRETLQIPFLNGSIDLLPH